MYAQWVEPTDDDLRAAVASMLGVEEGKLKILSSTSEAGSTTGDGMTSVLRAITVRYQVTGKEETGEARGAIQKTFFCPESAQSLAQVMFMSFETCIKL